MNKLPEVMQKILSRTRKNRVETWYGAWEEDTNFCIEPDTRLQCIFCNATRNGNGEGEHREKCPWVEVHNILGIELSEDSIPRLWRCIQKNKIQREIENLRRANFQSQLIEKLEKKLGIVREVNLCPMFAYRFTMSPEEAIERSSLDSCHCRLSLDNPDIKYWSKFLHWNKDEEFPRWGNGEEYKGYVDHLKWRPSGKEDRDWKNH